MSHFEDDDPPIKSHPASKEYRENFDRIFGEPDLIDRDVTRAPDSCGVCGATDHERVEGHRTDGGRNGNTHAIALCQPCRILVRETI